MKKLERKCERNKEQRCQEEPGQIDFSSYSPGSNTATGTSYQKSVSGEAHSTHSIRIWYKYENLIDPENPQSNKAPHSWSK